MTRFCLVRHGQTDWNLEGRYQGQSDVQINGQGRAQAQSAAGLLQGQPFAALYSSDLKRASETAEIIGAALHLTVRLMPKLREIHQGEWEGQLVEVIKARYTSLWQERTVDPASVRPPGGETVAEVAARVCAALDEIAIRHPAASILIVSHGLALATIICKVHGMSSGQAYHFIPENVQPVWVSWDVSIKEG